MVGREMGLQLNHRLKDGVADVTGVESLHGPPQQRLADPLGAVAPDAVGLIDDALGVVELVLQLLSLVLLLLVCALFLKIFW
jgi:hypothetical protein